MSFGDKRLDEAYDRWKTASPDDEYEEDEYEDEDKEEAEEEE